MRAFEHTALSRLGQFFEPAAAAHPGLSGFSLLSSAREAFITRLALADLAERCLDMQYYVWDGDTTGRIIVDRVMRAADSNRLPTASGAPTIKTSAALAAAMKARRAFSAVRYPRQACVQTWAASRH